MKNIEKEMLKAFNNRQDFKGANTRVINNNGVTYVYLFDDLIATKDYSGNIKYTLAGWNTVTTRSRLNALGCNVSSKNGISYRDGKPRYSDFDN